MPKLDGLAGERKDDYSGGRSAAPHTRPVEARDLPRRHQYSLHVIEPERIRPGSAGKKRDARWSDTATRWMHDRTLLRRKAARHRTQTTERTIVRDLAGDRRSVLRRQRLSRRRS